MLLVVVAALSVAGARAGQVYVAAPAGRGQYHRSQGPGGYNYGYNTGDGAAKVEVKRPDGSVVGSYRYYDPNGVQIVRSYVADAKGFRVLGNGLPVAPSVPAAAVLGAPALTAAVEGAGPAVVAAALRSDRPHRTLDIQNFRTDNSPLAIHYRQQQEVIQKQQELIKQQQELLNQLSSSSSTTPPAVEEELTQTRTSQQNIEPLRIENLRQRAAFILGQNYAKKPAPELEPASANSLTESFPGPRATPLDDPNYYFYPERHTYEFPAGFALGGVPAPATSPPPPPPVIGSRSDDAKHHQLTSGRIGITAQPRPPFAVVRAARPYVLGRT